MLDAELLHTKTASTASKRVQQQLSFTWPAAAPDVALQT